MKTTYLTDETHRRVKIEAAKRGLRLQVYLESLVLKSLNGGSYGEAKEKSDLRPESEAVQAQPDNPQNG